MSKVASNVAKGIAILMMLMHHLFYSEEVIASYSRGQEIIFDPLSIGTTIDIAQAMKICVAVFVFITAYGTFRQVSAKLDAAKPSASNSEARLSAGYALGHAAKLLINFQFVFLVFVIVGFVFPEHSVFTVYGGEGPINAGFWILCDFFGVAKLLGTPTFNVTWWYMSYALLLIFLMPAFVYLARKIGSLPLFMLSFMIPLMAGFDMSAIFWWYAPSVAMGTMCAQYNVFEKLDLHARSNTALKRAASILICLVLLGALLFLRQRVGFVWLFDALCAAVVGRLAMHLERFDVVFKFLGKHSMNMFFMHTFFHKYYFGAIIYSFHWSICIYLAFVLVSLCCSILIELFKKLLRVDRLRDWVAAKIQQSSAFALE